MAKRGGNTLMFSSKSFSAKSFSRKSWYMGALTAGIRTLRQFTAIIATRIRFNG